LYSWRELPPTLGTPHEGFYYPDPLGFWTEVRRWTTVIVRTAEPQASGADALAVSALLHLGEQPDRVAWALDLMRPAIVLFLDEASWVAAAIDAKTNPFSIPDPHRPGVVYEGSWGSTDSGQIVGKAPQHPAAHSLYKKEDMDTFLGAVPPND